MLKKGWNWLKKKSDLGDGFLFRFLSALLDTVWNLLSVLLCFILIFNFDNSPQLKDVFLLPELGLITFFMSYSSMDKFDALAADMKFAKIRKEAVRQLSLLSATIGLLAFTISFINARGYAPIILGREELLIGLNLASIALATILNISSHVRTSRKSN